MRALTLTQENWEETAVPTNQRAILTTKGLELVPDEPAEPQADEVRVRVLASGVAFADILCRHGMYPFMPKLPFTPGYDLVGVVDKVGNAVSSLYTGQRVGALLPKFGANATYACAPADQFVPLPENIDPVAGTAVILNYLTAYRILHDKAKARPGERLLVHSAAGGVGTAVLQLGRALGLELYGTTSTSKIELVASLGATPIDYQREDFAARLRRLTSDGVDIVCDPVGGQTMIQSYELLRPGGRLVNYGMMGTTGSKMGIGRNFARLAWYSAKPDGKKALFYGDTPSLVKRDNGWYRESLTALFVMLIDGRISPIIGATLPLNQISEAHHLLETGAIIGKIVLCA